MIFFCSFEKDIESSRLAMMRVNLKLMEYFNQVSMYITKDNAYFKEHKEH